MILNSIYHKNCVLNRFQYCKKDELTLFAEGRLLGGFQMLLCHDIGDRVMEGVFKLNPRST